MSNSLIRPKDRTGPGATTSVHNGPGSNGSEGVVRIPQSSSITEATPPDCFVSYPGHSLVESDPSVEIQSEYFAAPVDWARIDC